MENFKIGKDYIGVGGGILIFNKKKEVLLMQRGKNAKNESGWWSKPGGSVEFGEKAMDAMEREIQEELGISVKIWGYLPHVDHILLDEKQHWIALNFLADIQTGTPKNLEPDKCSAIGWFSLDKLPEKLTQTTREPIQNFLRKKYIRI